MFLSVIAIGLGVTLVMFAAWLYQRHVHNAGWVDVFWTFGTGAICTLAILAGPGLLWRRGMVAALLLLWSIRLGTHIARRLPGRPEDARYARMRAEKGAGFNRFLLGFLLIQGPFSAVLGVAALFAARQPAPGLRLWDALGIALSLGCIAGEALADRQMRHFRANPANKGKICNTGLWSRSRHPNYLFEFLSWAAYPVLALNAQHPWTLLSLGAPALMYLTLRYASGVPPLEAAMLESRGEAYRQYQAHTGAILPRLL
jgi:steroid 5-alpha reductase family enzyme